MGQGRRTRRRVLIWSVVGALAALVGGYVYLTSPGRLRAQALAALGGLPIHGLEVGEVTFTPWAGLQITDLVIRELGGGPELEATGLGPLLHVSAVRVQCDSLALLTGRVVARRIDIDEAMLKVVCDPARYEAGALADSWDDEAQQLWRLLRRWRERLPTLHVAQADLHLLTLERMTPGAGPAGVRGSPRLIERGVLRVTGAPETGGYRVRVERLPGGGPPLAEVTWLAATGDLDLRVDWVDVQTLERLLPPRAARWLAPLELAGRTRIDRLVLRTEDNRGDAATASAGRSSTAPKAIELQMADVRGVIPLEADVVPGGRPFLCLAGATASLRYERAAPAGPGHVDVQVAGQLNGAPARLHLAMQRASFASLYEVDEATPGSKPLTLTDVLNAELDVEGLDLPTAQSHPAFLNSPRLPGPVRSAFGDYHPQGKVNVRLRIVPPDVAGSEGRARLTGEVEALGAACTYRHFPYAFEDAWGKLRILGERIVFDGLSARHGSARICAEGALNSSKSWTGFELEFRGRNVPLDADLYAALPEEDRRLWEHAAPLGLCDVVTRLRRADGDARSGALPTEVQVDLHLLAGSFASDEQRRLDAADGRFTVRRGQIQLHDLHGYGAGAAVAQSGTVWMTDGRPHTDLRVVVADLPVVERAVLTTADDAGGAPEVQFVGRVDLWGRVCESGAAAPRKYHLIAHIKDGVLQALDPARAWTDSEGWLVARGSERQVLSFRCRQGDSWFNAAGELPPVWQAGEPLSLDLHAQADAMNELLPQFLPGGWAKLAETLGLAGAGDVRVTLRPSGSVKGQAAEIAVRAGEMRADPLPLPLHDVSATLRLEPGRFELYSSDARWGEAGRIQAQGAGTWTERGVQADLNLAARGMKFCPELNEALPEPVTRWLDTLAMQGEFDALLHRVRVVGGAERSWRLEGHIPLRNASFRLGLEMTQLAGEVWGGCTIAADGRMEVEAEFYLEQGRLAGRPMARWRGLLLRTAGERWVRVEDLRGQLCGGQIVGSVWLDPDSAEYELALTLKDVQANELLPPPKKEPARERPGWVDGALHLRGRGRDPTTRRGGGDLRLRGASFLHTPVLASVSEARPREPHGASDVVDQADIRFLWEGSLVRLQRVEIQSRDLRLVGEGVWDMRDDAIQLTLVGAHPRNWPRVAGLTELIESAGQELVQYRVEGTLSAPKVTAEPLYKLNEALRALIRGPE